METRSGARAGRAVGWFAAPTCHGLDQWRALAGQAGYEVRRLRELQPVAISARTLERHFHRQFGAAPSMMLQHWRVESARDHIIRTGAANKETAAAFGYADEVHLCHAFKRFLGRTPQSFSPARLSVINIHQTPPQLLQSA